MSFATEIDDPLKPLRENPVSEEIVRPISELLVTDLLVGTGRASSIRAFKLGVAIGGRRNLTLTGSHRIHLGVYRTLISCLAADCLT